MCVTITACGHNAGKIIFCPSNPVPTQPNPPPVQASHHTAEPIMNSSKVLNCGRKRDTTTNMPDNDTLIERLDGWMDSGVN